MRVKESPTPMLSQHAVGFSVVFVFQALWCAQKHKSIKKVQA
jgi:hypothetical protein